MPVPTPAPWGKLKRDDDGNVLMVQSLEDHSADVAAVFIALCRTSGIRRRLDGLAAPLTVDDVMLARLGHLVFLHDCGKANAGFQARREAGAPMVGHISVLAPLLGDSADEQWNALAVAALGLDRIATYWGEGAVALFDAILSHHGAPWASSEPRGFDRVHWLAQADGYNPIAALGDLRKSAQDAYPAAFARDSPPLPSSPRFVHAVAGLAQVADWVASSGWETAPTPAEREGWAEELLRDIGLDPVRSRETLLARPPLQFESAFSWPPRPHQEATGEIEGQCVILEAETGSGKTEAALWRFVRLFAAGEVDGLYFALPTRTAAAQLHRRVEAAAARLWGDAAPPVVLAVPGYLEAPSYHRRTITHGIASLVTTAAGELPPAGDPLDAPEGDTRLPSVWAAENPKRYFAATLSVGTVDQALLAAIRVKHAHLRGATLMRHLLVVDEVHASDSYMRQHLMQLLRDHIAAGGHALLLSATLGAEARAQFLAAARGEFVRDAIIPSFEDAVDVPYPLLTSTTGEARQFDVTATKPGVRLSLAPWLDDPRQIASAALEAAAGGARVLVMRNTVDGAIAVQRVLESLAVGALRRHLFALADVPTLHHSRFAREDRRRLDAEMERQFGRQRPVGGLVAVGTQTIEQSLDLDADYLITDLCPADVLLQRLGRLHRHERAPGSRPVERETPQAAVVVPAGGLAPFLSARPAGLRRHGLGHRILRNGLPGGVYADLAVLEATQCFIAGNPVWQIPAMNRRIVESALHQESILAVIESMPAEQRSDWAANHDRILGSDFAKGKLASNGALRRQREFRDPENVGFDEKLGTRLGTQDLLITLPPGTIGPFGTEVTRVAIQAWMLDSSIERDNVPAPRVSFKDSSVGFRLELGTLSFDYGRHGLCRIDPSTSTVSV